MALKDTWTDLEDAIDGVPDSGSEITVEPINAIAHAVIKNEDDINDTKDRVTELEENSGGQVDLSNYYTKEEVNDSLADKQDIGNMFTGNLNDTIIDMLGKELYPNNIALKYYVNDKLSDYYTKEEVNELFATKEEVGNIEEATAAIIALQNSYIGGETV